MNSYESHKESGIIWIGEIPTHWRQSKFKYITVLYTGNSLNENQKIEYKSDNIEDVPYVSSKDIDVESQTANFNSGLRIPKESKLFKLSPKGSFLMVIEGGSAGRKITFLDRDVFFVNKLCSFNSRENNKFQYYFIQSSNYQDKFQLSLSGMIGGVSISNLKNFELTLPPLEEQREISHYLDKKTGQIDLLIEKIQNKIELLKEYRTAVINQCVTKGLDPTVEMKDSGVEWIGEIPKHWETRRLATLGSFSKGKNITKDELTEDGDPVILYGHLYTTYDRRTDNPVYFISTSRSNRSSKIIKNTFLFTSSGESIEEIGKTLLYEGNKEINVGGDVILFNSFKDVNVNPKYFSFALNSKICQDQKSMMSRGEIVIHIYEKQLREIWVCVPSFLEQKLITKKLEKIESQALKLTEAYTKKVNLLKEYRQALISSVVTGKVRVTEDMI